MALEKLVLLLVAIVAVGLAVDVADAKEYVVGDDIGWRLGVDYNLWIKGKTFFVGDKLVFKYSPQFHNVIKVSSSDYKACKSSAADVTLTTGNDVVTLKEPGKAYYLCGVPTHCSQGQKLAIDVLPAAAAAAPGQAPVTAPSPSISQPPSPNGVAIPPKFAYSAMFVAPLVLTVNLLI